MNSPIDRIIKAIGWYDQEHILLNFQEYKTLGGIKSFPKYLECIATFFEYTFLAYIHGDLTKPDGSVWESSFDSFYHFSKLVGKTEANRIFASIDNMDAYT